MSAEPWRVRPTDPPSSTILISEHRQLQIRAGAADRVDYVFARLVFSETSLLNGPTAHGRVEHAVLSRPYLLAVEEPPASEPGWLLLAEVTVRAGQTTVEAEDIRPPGWHHQHGMKEGVSQESSERPAQPPNTRIMECRSGVSCPSYGRRSTIPLQQVAPGVLARPNFVCADCGMELAAVEHRDHLEET